MKRWITLSVVLVALIPISLTGCGGKKGTVKFDAAGRITEISGVDPN